MSVHFETFASNWAYLFNCSALYGARDAGFDVSKDLPRGVLITAASAEETGSFKSAVVVTILSKDCSCTPFVPSAPLAVTANSALLAAVPSNCAGSLRFSFPMAAVVAGTSLAT